MMRARQDPFGRFVTPTPPMIRVMASASSSDDEDPGASTMRPGIEPGSPCHDQPVPCRWAICLLDPLSRCDQLRRTPGGLALRTESSFHTHRHTGDAPHAWLAAGGD